MILLDPQWKYFTAEETRKPDYLAKRFAQIRRQLNEGAAALKTADEEPVSRYSVVGDDFEVFATRLRRLVR